MFFFLTLLPGKKGTSLLTDMMQEPPVRVKVPYFKTEVLGFLFCTFFLIRFVCETVQQLHVMASAAEVYCFHAWGLSI